MPRFVVLRHEPAPDSTRPLHWDLMLEVGQVLRTWALGEEPQLGREIVADQLPDHRLAYLDYEGPVSGNRGTVSQLDAGTYELRREQADCLEIILEGRSGSAFVRLEPSTEIPQRWMIRFERLAADVRRAGEC